MGETKLNGAPSPTPYPGLPDSVLIPAPAPRRPPTAPAWKTKEPTATQAKTAPGPPPQPGPDLSAQETAPAGGGEAGPRRTTPTSLPPTPENPSLPRTPPCSLPTPTWGPGESRAGPGQEAGHLIPARAGPVAPPSGSRGPPSPDIHPKCSNHPQFEAEDGKQKAQPQLSFCPPPPPPSSPIFSDAPDKTWGARWWAGAL